MSGWTAFAVIFTVLLLVMGSAFTLLVFLRAGRRMRAAERAEGVRVKKGARVKIRARGAGSRPEG